MLTNNDPIDCEPLDPEISLSVAGAINFYYSSIIIIKEHGISDRERNVEGFIVGLDWNHLES